MATKLDLIKQNRESWMSYIDAARAATTQLGGNSNNSSWLGSSTDIKNAKTVKDAMSSIDALSSGLGSDIDAVDSWNPDAPISTIAAWGTWATTVSELADAVSPTAKSIGTTGTRTALTSTPTSSSTNTQWNTSTIKWGTWASTQSQETIIEWQTNKVVADAASTRATNDTIDRTQYEQQKLAAEAYALETDTELKRNKAATEELAKEEDRIQRQKALDEETNMRALQEKERAANEASIAAASTKAAAAERELQIANDVELQKSNVAFAKLWLTLSTAAATSAQQIYTTWVYNLSKLKSENAFKMANLEVEVARVEFDHTAVINEIINKSAEKSYTIKKDLNEEVFKLQNSIIDNRYDRQLKIDSAIDKYQNALKENELEVLEKMGKANDVLAKSVDNYYATLKTKETYAQTKIDTAIQAGTWGGMSPVAQAELEKAAWLPTWTVLNMQKSYVTNAVLKMTEWLPFTSSELASINQEASRLMQSWVNRDLAIEMTLRQNQKYISSMIKKVASGSWVATKKYTSKIMTDSVTNESYNILFDKDTWEQVGAEKIVVPSVSQKTTYDTKWWLAAAWKAFLEWRWVAGAIASWGTQAISWSKTEDVVTMVPLKPKAPTESNQWEY